MTQFHGTIEETIRTEHQKLLIRKKIPAFPVQKYDGSWNDGMTLRDYFATKAMPLTYKHWMHDYYEFGFGDGDEARGLTSANKILIAETAYQMADAMMKAREE